MAVNTATPSRSQALRSTSQPRQLLLQTGVPLPAGPGLAPLPLGLGYALPRHTGAWGTAAPVLGAGLGPPQPDVAVSPPRRKGWAPLSTTAQHSTAQETPAPDAGAGLQRPPEESPGRAPRSAGQVASVQGPPAPGASGAGPQELTPTSGPRLRAKPPAPRSSPAPGCSIAARALSGPAHAPPPAPPRPVRRRPSSRRHLAASRVAERRSWYPGRNSPNQPPVPPCDAQVTPPRLHPWGPGRGKPPCDETSGAFLFLRVIYVFKPNLPHNFPPLLSSERTFLGGSQRMVSLAIALGTANFFIFVFKPNSFKALLI